jgi:hypothetical protein
MDDLFGRSAIGKLLETGFTDAEAFFQVVDNLIVTHVDAMVRVWRAGQVRAKRQARAPHFEMVARGKLKAGEHFNNLEIDWG